MLALIPSVATQAELVKAASAEGGLKVWDMANMGLQATAHVLGYTGNAVPEASASHDPLTRLTTLTGDFPSLSKWITTLKFPETVPADVEKNKQQVGGLMNSMLVNGIAFDVTSPQFNIFNLFNTVKKEFEVAEMMDALPFDASYVKTVKNAAMRHAAKVWRFPSSARCERKGCGFITACAVVLWCCSPQRSPSVWTSGRRLVTASSG